MRKLLILFIIIPLVSCGNLLHTERMEVTYTFVNIEGVSENIKKTTSEVIKRRLNSFINNVDVQLNSKNEIVVTVSTKVDVNRLNTIIENQGKLDFWNCIEGKELLYFLLEADKELESDTITKPLTSMVKYIKDNGFPIFSVNDTIQVKQLLRSEKIQHLYSKENKYLSFLFGKPDNEFTTLYAFISNRQGRSKVNEKHITLSRQEYDQLGRPIISIEMDNYGANKWYNMTNDAFNNLTNIAISINDIVYSAPTVANGPITGGKSQISGNFSLVEAQDLAAILNGNTHIPKLKFLYSKKIEK